MVLDQYYYKKLTISQQILYKKICDAILRHDNYVICGKDDYTDEEIKEILYKVKWDISGAFCVKEECMIEQTLWGVRKIHFKYYFTKEEKKQVLSEIDQYVQSIILKNKLLEIESEKAAVIIHDELILKANVETLDGDEENDSCPIMEIFFDQRMTCKGCAYAYKYLMNAIGIECNIVSIENYNGNNILYNIIKLYGENRYVNVYEDAVVSKNNKINYDFFGLTEELMLKKQIEKINCSEKNKKKTQIIIEKKEKDIDDYSTTQEKFDINNIVLALKSIVSSLSCDDIKECIGDMVEKLEKISDMGKQYPENEELFEQDIWEPLECLINVLKEYYRYEKYSATKELKCILQEKIHFLMNNVMSVIQHNMNIFWNQQTENILKEMNEIQKNLIEKNKNKKPCPIDINLLSGESDLQDYIMVFDYIKQNGLPQKINDEIIEIIYNLNNLHDAIEHISNKYILIDQLKVFYLKEAIRLIFRYEEYEYRDISEKYLEELVSDIANSLHSVKEAIDLKLKEIYKFEMMEVTARAKALADVIGQDGYVQSKFKTN